MINIEEKRLALIEFLTDKQTHLNFAIAQRAFENIKCELEIELMGVQIALASLESGLVDWKQRAEAAEHALKDANICVEAAKQEIGDLESELAELKKQEPVAYITEQNLKSLRKGLHDCFVKRKPVMVRPVALFTRPAPAVSLAELVPEEVLCRLEYEANHLVHHCHHIDEHSCKVDRRDLLTLVESCRAAILRNIEGQSQ